MVKGIKFHDIFKKAFLWFSCIRRTQFKLSLCDYFGVSNLKEYLAIFIMHVFDRVGSKFDIDIS